MVLPRSNPDYSRLVLFVKDYLQLLCFLRDGANSNWHLEILRKLSSGTVSAIAIYSGLSNCARYK